MAQDGNTAGGNSYTIDNVTFPVGRTKLNSIFNAVRTTNMGSSAPDLVAGQFWIDNTTPSATVWTLYFYDGTDSIQFATIDTTNNTVNFIDSTFTQLTSDLATNGNNINFGDNDKAQFGASNDLQIYHDGSNSKIQETGTGNLFIDTSDALTLRQYSTNSVTAKFVGGGASELYHNNSKKLETTSTGVDVTGTVVSDGLTVDTNTLYVDSADNRVGINNNDPLNSLHIISTSAGSFSAGLRITNADTTAGTATGIALTNSTDTDSPTNTAFIKLERLTSGQNILDIQTNVGSVDSSRIKFSQGEAVINDDSRDFDFRVESNTNTHALFVQGSDGSVAIGTNSPSANFHVDADTGNSVAIFNSATGANVYIQNDTATVGNYSQLIFNHNQIFGASIQSTAVEDFSTSANRTAKLDFKVRNNGTISTAMTILNDGNVGIGVTSPDDTFHVSGGTAMSGGWNRVARLEATYPSLIWESTYSNGFGGIAYDSASNSPMVFWTGGTSSDVHGTGKRALMLGKAGGTTVFNEDSNDIDFRVESNNNTHALFVDGGSDVVMIGKSSTSSAVAGTTLWSGGYLNSTVASDYVARFNRTTNDGDVIQIYKDNVTVGSIGTISSNLTITPTNDLVFTNGDGDAIGFHRDDSFRPRTNDATHDFGTSSKRWRNLYLSGNIYLGGTGSANALDDYETGTWSVVLTPSTSGSITLKASANLFSYTKIGDIVFFTGRIQVDSVASPVGSLTLAGLPFTSANLDDTAGITHFPMFTYGVNLASPISTMLEVAEGATNGGVLQQQDDAGWGALDASGVSANDFFTINGSYRVA